MITPEEIQAVREFAAFVSLFGEIAEVAGLDGWQVMEVPAGTWEWVATKPTDDSGRFRGISLTVFLHRWRWQPKDSGTVLDGRTIELIMGRSHLTHTIYWWSQVMGESFVSRFLPAVRLFEAAEKRRAQLIKKTMQ